ncbi:MAG: dihydrofolate reductase [Oscillospiraceae bacterium]
MDAIVAVYSDWGIGDGGTQPVVLKADRRHFRSLTDGSAVIVGGKTLADFPGGKPLANRFNIVVSRQGINVDGALVVHSTGEALDAAEDFEQCFVIGGASVYMQFFNYLERVYVTKIDTEPQSDSFFPNLDRNPEWECVSQEPWEEEDGIRYCFCTYEKKFSL